MYMYFYTCIKKLPSYLVITETSHAILIDKLKSFIRLLDNHKLFNEMSWALLKVLQSLIDDCPIMLCGSEDVLMC
jgi:hypothetical protein